MNARILSIATVIALALQMTAAGSQRDGAFFPSTEGATWEYEHLVQRKFGIQRTHLTTVTTMPARTIDGTMTIVRKFERAQTDSPTPEPETWVRRTARCVPSRLT